MTKNERRLAGELLGLAADQFSRHGCNDFDRPEWFPVDEWNSLQRQCSEMNGTPEEYCPSDHDNDWVLMHFLGRMLEEG